MPARRLNGGSVAARGVAVGPDPGHEPDPSGRYTWKKVDGSLAPALVAPPAMYTAPLHTAAWMPCAPTGMSGSVRQVFVAGLYASMSLRGG